LTIFGRATLGGQLTYWPQQVAERRCGAFDPPDLAVSQYRALGSGLLLLIRGVIDMPLLNLVVVLIVIGMALWLVNRYIPMAASIKAILNVVVVVAVGVFVLKAAGLWGDVTSFRIGR
jgi:hypothetical protein